MGRIICFVYAWRSVVMSQIGPALRQTSIDKGTTMSAIVRPRVGVLVHHVVRPYHERDEMSHLT